MQVYARSTKIPIDTLAFYTFVTEDLVWIDEELTGHREKGVNIHGLYIQGCGWENVNSMLKESEKSVLFDQMPVIWLDPVLETELAAMNKGRYISPLYKTSERRGALSTT